MAYVISTCQIFKDATLFFSQSTPNLVTVIPAMDHIDETLTSQSIDPHFEPSIRAALGLAKKTLNHYYSATDQSDVYRIVISMYPSHSVSLYSTLLFQSYTPAVSFSISRQPDGRMNGSKQRKNLQGKYLNENMPGNPPRTTPRRMRT